MMISSAKEFNLDDLKALFDPQDLEWRIAESGKTDGKIWARCLCYIQNRAIMNRLDDVVGPANWKNRFFRGPNGGVLCGISIKIDGEWVEKIDGADNTDIEAVKGGLSDSMKRAGVQWGIARYLYDLEAGWADVRMNRADGYKKAKLPESKGSDTYFWAPPQLPLWAVPGSIANQPKPAPEAKPKTTKAKPAPSEPTDTVAPPVGNAPGSEAAAISKALSAINNAPDSKTVDRYVAAIRKRGQDGEFTAGEVKVCEQAGIARIRALGKQDLEAFDGTTGESPLTEEDSNRLQVLEKKLKALTDPAAIKRQWDWFCDSKDGVRSGMARRMAESLIKKRQEAVAKLETAKA